MLTQVYKMSRNTSPLAVDESIHFLFFFLYGKYLGWVILLFALRQVITYSIVLIIFSLKFQQFKVHNLHSKIN